ncbi:MAG: ribonuclease R [Ruminococcus sp.]|nr:ribonuclease R [Ruminococcus sp.]
MSKKKNTENKLSVEGYKKKITAFLKTYNKRLMPFNELEKKCHTKKYGRDNFVKAFDELRSDGTVMMRKGMKTALTSRLGIHVGKITRLSRTFGFAESDNGTEYFIPGKCMMGAMPDDRVLISDIPSRSGEPEGEIVDILSIGMTELTGRIKYIDFGLYFVPDIASNTCMMIDRNSNVEFNEDDKVLAEISYRGKRHAEHKVKIISSFGSSESAFACSESILAMHGIDKEFPNEVIKEAHKISEGGVQEYSFNNREDLRRLNIFTIDSAESKDLDDAVSVERTENGYLLGVHIADVSHYVKGNSELDKEALHRGTSIYYADKVIPMLPKELSNGICSLNPDENRLTISAFMELDGDGKMLSYRFCKSVIKSRVKGIYSEINKILDGTADNDILAKYDCVAQEIQLMNELADILIKAKKRRHAPELETIESKLIINENGMCVDILPRERGKSERIIEEFMLCANEAAAKLAKEKNVPFVYRIHETPPDEKTAALCELLTKLNIEYPHFEEFSPSHAAEILDNARGTDKFEAVNMMVLRSMAKAKYSEEPLGHFGLVLKDYAHFTSPIRRYPDLAIHRIITDILAGYNETWLNKRYSGFVIKASENSSNAEVRAVSVERECEDCYKAEYMKSHIGESFMAKISGVTEYGFYAQLPNSVEGLVHVRTLPEGEYDYSEPVSLTEKFSGVSYELGDTVQVLCASVNVSSGNIDFVLDEED